MTDRHNNKGNCWGPDVVYDCAQCEPEACDVCHEHEQPRGECEMCLPCPICNEESL